MSNLSIEQFNCLLHTKDQKDPLLAALFSITGFESPEIVIQAAVGPQVQWSAWF